MNDIITGMTAEQREQLKEILTLETVLAEKLIFLQRSMTEEEATERKAKEYIDLNFYNLAGRHIVSTAKGLIANNSKACKDIGFKAGVDFILTFLGLDPIFAERS